MKHLFSRFLAMALTASLCLSLVISASAATADPGKVDFTIDAPQIGKTPDFSAVSNNKAIETDGHLVVWYWSSDTSGTKLSETDTFSAGYDYTVQIYFAYDPNVYSVPDEENCTVNGKPVTKARLAEMDSYVTYTFHVSREDSGAVDLTIDVPEAGKTPDFSAVSNNKAIETDGHLVEWYMSSDVSSTSHKLSEAETFKAGYDYTVQIYFAYDPNVYNLPDEKDCTINGKPVTKARLAEVDSYLAYTFRVPYLEPGAVNLTIDAPEAGKTPDFSAVSNNKAIETDGHTVYWYKGSSMTAENRLSSTDTFQGGEVYTVQIYFAVSDLNVYTFPNEQSCTVNGNAKIQHRFAEVDSYLAYTFPPADLPPILVDPGQATIITLFPFTDVSALDYFYDAVAWAYNNNVTTGETATTFGPQNTCTRGQVVTFLWRAWGCPEPTSTKNPFTDIKSDQYWYKAILWAVERGITNGTTATTFSPNDLCTEAHIITFIWRADNGPAADVEKSKQLLDSERTAYYAKPVAWAESKGMYDAIGKSFNKNLPAPRCDVVTFLYTEFAK